MKLKLEEWFFRYLPFEIVATVCAFIGGLVAYHLTRNSAIIAFVAAWSENIGYYATVIIRELQHRSKRQKISFSNFLKIMRDVVLEFGVAENIDNFLLRPFFMYIMLIVLKNLLLGLIAGKIITDIFFYGTVIIFYEMRKKVFPN